MTGMKLKADRIFDGYNWLEKHLVLIVDKHGKIIEIIPESEAGDDILFLNGILCPGFVNAHAHLELSHLKDKVERRTGLTGFLLQVVKQRGFDPEYIREAMIHADQEMYRNGIQAVGDICNTSDSIPIKTNSHIRWYNFIEVLSSRDEGWEQKLAHFTALRNQFRNATFKDLAGISKVSASLAPHAPYSVSPKSFQAIDKATKLEATSLHSQESMAEDELFRKGTGPFLEFYRSIGLTESPVAPTGTSSLRSVLPYFHEGQHILLVHNTFTSKEDLKFADQLAVERGLSIHYCLCPNANLFIEGVMPPIPLLMEEERKIVIGTDSLASNDGLSIASEINTIQQTFPSIPLEQILKWATSNGAEALGFDNELGSFTPGKKPGIIRLDDQLTVKRIC